MPSSSSDSGKTVSDAASASGDSTPPETDMGMQRAQMAEGDVEVSSAPLSPAAEGEDEPRRGDAPEPFSVSGSDEAGPTAGPADKRV